MTDGTEFNVERDVEVPLGRVRPKTEAAADVLAERQGAEIGAVLRELAADPPEPERLLVRVENMEPETRRDAIAWLFRYAEELADTGFEEAAEVIIFEVVEPLSALYNVRPADFL